MPRTLAVSLEKLVEVIRKHENVLFEGNSSKLSNAVGPSHEIWFEIAKETGNKISPKSAYTILKCNRNDILNRLGKTTSTEQSVTELEGSENATISDDKSTSNSEDEGSELRRFNLQLSGEEWSKISVQEVPSQEKRSATQMRKKMYCVLKPGAWTAVIHAQFWETTKLPCSITYKRSKVYAQGAYYCKFFGSCNSCGSMLTGILVEKPRPNQRLVTFNCTYRGHFNQCKPYKKRKMSSSDKICFANKLIKEGQTASMIRRIEADNIMQFGDVEPSHLPSANALRLMKSRFLKSKRVDEDPILAVCQLKYMHPYLNTIRDVGYDRFFMHYWTSTEITVYREYTRLNKFPTVCIDATGSLVRKPILKSGRKTKHILLYEIAVNDKTFKIQYSVCHMLSERHDNNSINHWLTEWLRSGAPCPKQVVTDMSLALLSGVVKSFTQYTSLWDYIKSCFDILKGDNDIPISPPSCFVRCDVAHVIKLITRWTPFRLVDKRIKEFTVRTLAQIVLSQSLKDVTHLLQCLFWVLYSETDGVTRRNVKTYAEKGRCCLKERIATGIVDTFLKEAEKVRDTESENYNNSCTDEDDCLEEFTESNGNVCTEEELHVTDRNRNNPFYMMAHNLAMKCRADVSNQEGDHDNLHYLPSLVPHILNLCSYLPLWSGIMCESFGFGDNPPSSAPIESQFSDLKNRVLKHCDLPLRVDEFIKEHIASLNGTMKLVWSKMANPSGDDVHNSPASASEKSASSVMQEVCVPSFPSGTVDQNVEICSEMQDGSMRTLPSETVQINENLNTCLETEISRAGSCPCCMNGDFPTGAHKCISCHRPVHLLDGCSATVGDEEGYGERRLCLLCYENLRNEENRAQENWRNIQNESPRKKKSVYMTPKRELLYKNMDSRAKTKVIGVLRNGNSTQFKSIKLPSGNFILSNTCSFDSAVQILAVAYCDSDEYAKFVNNEADKYILWNLVSCLLKDGVTVQTYRKRAKILSKYHSPEMLPNNIQLLSVEQPVDTLLSNLLQEYPSATLKINCTPCNENRSESKTIFPVCLKVYTHEEISMKLLENTFITCIEEFITSGQCKNSRLRSRRCQVGTSLTLGSHIVFSIINTANINNSDIGQDTPMQLNQIPLVLTVNNRSFHLRGVITTPVMQQELTSRTSVGHFKAHCYREPLQMWQLYDDLTDKVLTVKQNVIVNVQALIFSK